MGEINGSSYAGAIVSNAAAIALDRACADEVDRRANDGLLTSIGLSGAAATGMGVTVERSPWRKERHRP